MSAWLANGRQDRGTAIPLIKLAVRKEHLHIFLLASKSLYRVPTSTPNANWHRHAIYTYLVAGGRFTQFPQLWHCGKHPPTLRLTYKSICLGGSCSNYEFNKSFILVFSVLFPILPFNSSKCIQTDFRHPLIIFVVPFFSRSVTFFRSNSGMASGKQTRP